MMLDPLAVFLTAAFGSYRGAAPPPAARRKGERPMNENVICRNCGHAIQEGELAETRAGVTRHCWMAVCVARLNEDVAELRGALLDLADEETDLAEEFAGTGHYSDKGTPALARARELLARCGL